METGHHKPQDRKHKYLLIQKTVSAVIRRDLTGFFLADQSS